MLVFAQETFGLVTHDDIGASGDAELDAHHRRDCAGQVLGALVDADPTRDQPVVKPFQLGDARPDLPLRLFRAWNVMEGDLERNLQHRLLHTFGAF